MEAASETVLRTGGKYSRATRAGTEPRPYRLKRNPSTSAPSAASTLLTAAS